MIKLGAPPPEPTKTCVRELVLRLGIELVLRAPEWLGRATGPRFKPLQRTDGSGSSLQQDTQSSQT